jgi:hypothetical protein
VRSEKAIFRLVIPVVWLVGTAAVLVADVVASIQYGLDLGKVLVRNTKAHLIKYLPAVTLKPLAFAVITYGLALKCDVYFSRVVSVICGLSVYG